MADLFMALGVIAFSVIVTLVLFSIAAAIVATVTLYL